MALDALIPLLFGGFALVIWLILAAFFVAMYVYMGITLSTIAKKTKTEPTWLAWIPIANLYLLIKVGGLSPWWMLGFIVPLLNTVVMIMVWWKVCEARGKPGALALLFLVPVANIILPGYLAWSK